MRADPGKVTIYTVAERAGVSISTVSLVTSAPHRVSAATRERVVAAAAELGYRPGRSTSSSSGALRVVVAAPFSSYPSYFRRLAGMMAHAHEAAVELSTFDLPSAAASPSPLLDALPARPGVDGVIVMGVPLSAAALRASRQSSLPVVAVDVRPTRPRGSDLPVVLVDDVAGGRAIGEHLRALGHRRAVFLHEPQLSQEYVSAGMLRAEGAGEHIELVDAVAEPGRDPGEALLAALAADDVHAVFANHDELAARAWRALHRAGRRVPEDVALVGYDDGDVAQALDLTTVAQPFEETGRAAVDLLLGMVSGLDSSVSRVDLRPRLVVRGTTRTDEAG